MDAVNTNPTIDDQPDSRFHDDRWRILAVVCLAVFIVLVDGTIVNVAIPSLVTDLGASTRELQWIVDAYNLVFAGLLLAGGSLGDRYGRRRTLLIGLVVFGATSALAGSVDSAGALIVSRGLMGIGAALIFPATLAIITNVFIDPVERAKAIGIWGAVSGIAVAAGPIVGGALLESYWWGSVFFINVPIVIGAIAAVIALVPETRDTGTPRLDYPGVLLSILAIGTLVFTIIEAPEWGWTDPKTLTGFVVSVMAIGAFVRWELSVESPMLPVRIFKNLRFSAASVAITSAFFALFGFIFLITQYFQLVLNYSPLQAGFRVVPVAVAIAIGSVVSPALANRFGTTGIVAIGLLLMAVGFAWVSTASAVTPYLEIVGQMLVVGTGLGFTTAPATESIMGSLSKDKAGVGSAVNDTTRELGGTLGVAIIGSVFNSVYLAALADGPVVSGLPAEARAITEESVGAARSVASQLGSGAAQYLEEVNNAFLSGLSTACLVSAAVTLLGALFVARFLPAHAH